MSAGTAEISWKWRSLNCDNAVRTWLESGAFTAEEPFKKNGVRTIWKSVAPDGKTYFIKRERRGLFSLRNKAALEVKASRLLSEKAGIDCVSFSAFGTSGRNTLLVSPAVEHAVSLKEYWFHTAAYDPEKRNVVLTGLRDLLRKMQSAKLRHADFHAGNVLVDTETCRMTLADLAEIRFASSSDTAELAHICTDLLPLLTDDEAQCVIGEIDREPAACWTAARASLLALIEHEWHKRRSQILSGNSKFSRTVRCGDHTYEVASDDCFIRQELPEDLSVFTRKELPLAEAENLWLGMFRARLEGRICAERYAVLERCGTTAILYVAQEKDGSSAK